jgi:anti-sigma B factor antagonist
MADRDLLNVSVTDRSGVTVLAPAGEIGYHEAPILQTAIKSAYDKKPRKLVIDLTGVSYMATPGLATLVEGLQISKKNGTPLVLTGLTERVRAVFEIARLNTVFKITVNVDEAVTL